MLKTYLYIPEHLNQRIHAAARTQKKSKAEIIRQALQAGLHMVEKQHKGGAELLLQMAQLGKKYNLKGPKDSSEKMDEYL